MASMAKLVAEVMEEIQKLTWKIPSASMISEQLLIDHTIQFGVSHSSAFASKWLAGLSLCPKGYLEVTVTILEKARSSLDILAKGEINISKTEEPGPGHLAVPIDNWVSLATNQNLVFKTKRHLHKIKARMESGSGYIWFQLWLHFKTRNYSSSVLNETTTFVDCSNQKLKQNLAVLKTDGQSADLKILCSDGVELVAHRALMAVRNTVLDTMMRVDMSEKNTGEIKIDDVSSTTMEILLHYWYTGELMDEWTNSKIIHEFVYAAGKYQLEEVLELLDNVLGTEKVPTFDLQLLNLVSQLGLKNADRRIAEGLGKLLSQAKSGVELLRLCDK